MRLTRSTPMGWPMGLAQWAAAVIAVVLPCQSAVAGYRVGPGDAVEISVLGVPDLQRRMLVEPDGTISLPVVGSLAVQGLTSVELRAHVKAALGGRVVTLQSPSTPVAISIDDVLVTVAAYRPIFVKGDVAKPGEYPYRAAMAIREVVALSGGFLRALAGEQNALRAVELRAELESLWLDFAAQQSRLWRIKSELGEQVEERGFLSKRVPANAPIDRSVLARIIEVAANHLETRQINYQREEGALQQIIAQLNEEISVTGAQVLEDEKSYKAEVEELARLTALVEKGVVSQPRLADARRDLLSASTRVLMGTTRLHDAKRQRTERQLQLYKLGAERKSTLHQELETANARLNDIEARLRGTSEKLRFLEGSASADGDGSQPQAAFVVRRRNPEGLVRLVADEDFELLPGDVVDVRARGAVVSADAQASR
jgi:polysaccharide biosynthesis/export protein